jgi:DNA-binding transcriptional ArsR family regulator
MPRRRKGGGNQGLGRPAEGPLGRPVMHVLSEQLRARVLAILCRRVASPREIATELGAGLRQVSYHVDVLLGSDLVVLDHTVERDGTLEHFYRAIPELFEGASGPAKSSRKRR